MAYECKVVLDSVNPGLDRLTTLEVTYPRFVHAEMLTHRMFSRNSSSSRAIPIAKLIQRVKEDPAGPIWWGKNQKGMKAEKELKGLELELAQSTWLAARDSAVVYAEGMETIGVHKQIVNRIIEPWMWITVIITATEWTNFFNLRCHPDAQPEIRHIAEMMEEARQDSVPQGLKIGEWHIPYLVEDDMDRPTGELLGLSAARCARVSYLTHDGEHNPKRDLIIYHHLATNGHWSPLEHQAMAMVDSTFAANFLGWSQFRHLYAGFRG